MSSPNAAILIVDDQEQNIRMVAAVLSAAGYEIVPALSGEQAFKRLRAGTPDLILLDMLMPVMDGLEVCRLIKAEPVWQDIPVIFLSAADDKHLVVKALQSGGVDYVTKPFNQAELLSRVRTHLELKRARDQLRQLAEDKDELLGILAHDLKNHLAGIKLSAGMLASRRDELPPRSATLAENIEQSTDRMLLFVREFLANQSAERLTLHPGPLSLTDLVQAAVNRHRDPAAVKNITVEVEVPSSAVTVTADPEALTQVLENLLTNAIKFSPQGSRVKVSVTAPVGGVARCTVADEGPGFTVEDRVKLFQRYGRLSTRPTGGEPSTGLGLSIVKRLVEAMGSLVVLESAPGEGARFRLEMPAPS